MQEIIIALSERGLSQGLQQTAGEMTVESHPSKNEGWGSHIAFHEWVDMGRDVWNAAGWRNKLRYAFGNPAWRQEVPVATRQFPTTHEGASS